jgi:hypothetical protein
MKKSISIIILICTFMAAEHLYSQSLAVEAIDSVRTGSEWETYFMPGLEYHFYIPDDSENLGEFQGISVEYLIAAWIHKNERQGPSHGRVYTRISFMNSSQDTVTDIFYTGLGIDLSLERNPSRDYLIPFFGLELGGMFHKQFENLWVITPTLGVHIWSSENLFVNVTGGYIYPTKKLEELRGYSLRLGVNFSLW